MAKSLLGKIQSYFWDKTRWSLPPIAKPWFRGHEDKKWKLAPSIFRDGWDEFEFPLTKRFRLLAPGFGVEIPKRHLDEWLFLMQHNRAPTRLLDWTESLNTAIFFACLDSIEKRDRDKDGVVYALNPIFLNKQQDIKSRDFPPTWIQGRVLQTIKFAFGTADERVKGKKIVPLELPVAIFPSTVHGRMRSQKSCFTLHGTDKSGLSEIFSRFGWSKKMLVKYVISKDNKRRLVSELALAGTTFSTVYPDLEGLAKDLQFHVRDPIRR
jgi:hypothetical protein